MKKSDVISVGIDNLSFYVPSYVLNIETFALARGYDETKFRVDFGQEAMAVIPPSEDIVTMAANACYPLLTDDVIPDIEMILFATESSNDLSKAAATYLHSFFNLPSRCRVIELKQACYGATFGLQMALSWLRQNTEKKVLLVASDIAHYPFNSIAEASHGSGAVALLLSAKPRIMALEAEAGFCTKDTMDFWRPNYSPYAFVDGRLSCNTYLRLAEESYRQYAAITGRDFLMHDRFCYHVPVPRLVESTHKKLARINGIKNLTAEQLAYQIENSLVYNRKIGNCYTASLYVSLCSLLENTSENLAGKLVGLYSYGSGSIGEFFAGRVAANYKHWLRGREHQTMLARRQRVSMNEYETWYSFCSPRDDSYIELPKWDTGKFYLKEFNQHQRIYEASNYHTSSR